MDQATQRKAGEYLVYIGGVNSAEMSPEALPREVNSCALGVFDQVKLVEGTLLSVIERFPLQKVLGSGPERGTYAARALQDALLYANIPLALTGTGHALDLGRDRVAMSF